MEWLSQLLPFSDTGLFFLAAAAALMMVRQAVPDDADDEADEALMADISLNMGDLAAGSGEDAEVLRQRIESNRAFFRDGDNDVAEELAQDCLTMALEGSETEEESSDWYQQAIDVLEEVIRREESPERIRMLGLTRLSYAVMLNDSGLWTEALGEYEKAACSMKRLADAGDVEAKLDLAGIELNRVTIQFETQDQPENSQTLLKNIAAARERFESLLTGSQKTEASFYLAKTLLLEASILDQAEQNIEANDACRRGCDLLRELVEAGHEEYRSEFAESLAIYAERLMDDPETGEYQPKAALPAAQESAAQYRRLLDAGDSSVMADTFDTGLMEAKLLFDSGQNSAAVETYNRLETRFTLLEEANIPEILTRLASLYSGRGSARRKEERFAEAQNDWTKAIELRGRVLSAPREYQCGHHHEGHGGECQCGHHHEDHGGECQCGHHHEGHEGECQCGHHHEGREGECQCGHHHDHQPQVMLDQILDRILRAETSILLRDRETAQSDYNRVDADLTRLSGFLAEEYPAYRALADELARNIACMTD